VENDSTPDSGISAVSCIVMLLIAIIGILDAAYLSRVHLTAAKTCVAGDGCSTVLASSWATMAGIPVAAVGVGMYLALAGFAFQMLRCPDKWPESEPWMFAISGAGFGCSLFFTLLQALVIRQWCPLCLFSAVLTTAFFLICLDRCMKTGSLAGAMRHPRRMGPGLPWALLAFFLPPLIVMAAGAGGPKTDSGDRVVATMGDAAHTLADVDRGIQGKLQQLDEQRYRIREAFLEETLIAFEAGRQGVTPEALIQKEIADTIAVEEEEIRRFILENRARLPVRISPDVIQQIENRIWQKKMAAARTAYLERLKEIHGVHFDLPMPERLTVVANPRGGPVTGPADAPVTIVVFTDFKCPFCRMTHDGLHRLMDRFPGKIRLAFRHFPLAMHEWAKPAAEYAHCAHLQGQFWPFADAVFGHSGQLSEAVLAQYAEDAGITDRQAFNRCVASGPAKRAVADDIAEGKSLGVRSTPSLFINGRFFSGMPKNIDAIIEEEILTAAEPQ
jgi:uncharacterized membrane protein/glutaredoxin